MLFSVKSKPAQGSTKAAPASKVRSRVRKTWRAKLADDKELPKVLELEGVRAARWGGRTMVIARPRDVDQLIRSIRKGRTATINDLRRELAKAHGTETACPITTGIFAWIAAHAAAEDEADGRQRITPWWRVLKDGDKLNPKYPGGVEEQARRLCAEGHRVEHGRVIRDEGGKLKSGRSSH